jgi:hypothetical protein
MFGVYQHWDPLRVCVVGRSYPPEFYSWIKVSHVRSLFEKIAIETEEDYQHLIAKLQQFGVEVIRPNLPKITFKNGAFVKPPMTPRDHTVMIGQTFYASLDPSDDVITRFYNNIKDNTWPICQSVEQFYCLPREIQNECFEQHGLTHDMIETRPYEDIVKYVKNQGNLVKTNPDYPINGAMVSRIGQDLFFGTDKYTQDQVPYKKFINEEFPDTRNHVINTGGHSDGTYCPVAPGLIISLKDVPTYQDTYPGWEVVYLPGQSWAAVQPFLDLKEKNQGRWWIPGFEHDTDVVNVVESWLGHWTGYVEETVFDVNMLIIDPKNVMVFNYNQQVFDALERHGITPHIVPFRHRYFWDGGIHCITSDLHREGVQQNFFPNRD